jgi:hypothetical protein
VSDLSAGTQVRALDFPPAAWASDSTAQTNVSSGSFVPGSPEVGVTFTAPTSGRVRVDVSGGVRDDTGQWRGVIAFEVYEGNTAGAKVVSASSRANGMSSIAEATAYQFHSRGSLVEGLAPGAVYYARLMQAVSGGTSVDILHRSLIVYPVP